MKLALYLPNFRDKVTVKELEDLTSLAEQLAFDSVWTLDRIVVPEASDPDNAWRRPRTISPDPTSTAENERLLAPSSMDTKCWPTRTTPVMSGGSLLRCAQRSKP
jgi:hypothetical protein